jgi:hypothetical protein
VTRAEYEHAVATMRERGYEPEVSRWPGSEHRPAPYETARVRERVACEFAAAVAYRLGKLAASISGYLTMTVYRGWAVIDVMVSRDLDEHDVPRSGGELAEVRP